MIFLLRHITEHCGIAIQQQEGDLLCCGDACYSHFTLNPKHHAWSLNLTE